MSNVVPYWCVERSVALRFTRRRLFTDDRVLDARDALANTIGVIAGLGTQLTPLRDVVLRLDRKRDQS